MIDINSEELLTLAEAAALLPKPPSVAALWRWRYKGVGGRRLETVKIGGRIYTTARSLQAICQQQGGEPGTTRTSKQRELEIAKAERTVAQAGRRQRAARQSRPEN